MDREIIHRLLDKELTEAEEEAAIEILSSDHSAREEAGMMMDAIDLLGKSDRKRAPSSFTSEVMKKLPSPAPVRRRTLKEFMFGERVFRWNMASAAGAAILVLIVLAAVYYDGGKPPSVAQNAAKEDMVPVRFAFVAPDAESVSLTGDFNRWNVNENAMQREANGIWTVEITLKPGAYNYMFVVDGKVWVPDPSAAAYRDDGFGSRNSLVRVSNL
jgi:hypothetical protein